MGARSQCAGRVRNVVLGVVKAEPSKVDDVLRQHSQSVAPLAPIGEGILRAACVDKTDTDEAV